MAFADYIRQAISTWEHRDQELYEELQQRREDKTLPLPLPSIDDLPVGVDATTEAADPARSIETIVYATGRPVLAIQDGAFKPEFSDDQSEVWKHRLEKARDRLFKVIPAVGRINISGLPDLSWVGTGWLASTDIVVTNRHVALVFAAESGAGFVFRSGVGAAARMSAGLDFLKEFDRTATAVFPVVEILWIEPEPGPDLALLRISAPDLSRSLPQPIEISPSLAATDEMVAAIGYPARDSRIPDQDRVLRIFGDIYDKKRLAPGQISAVTARELQHDCSTLGGNSGSVLVSLHSGQAVGLHYAGLYERANYAIPSTVLHKRIQEAVSGRLPPVTLRPSSNPSTDPTVSLDDRGGGQSMTWRIPLEVTIRLGEPIMAGLQAGVGIGRTGLHPSSNQLQRSLRAARKLAAQRDDIRETRVGFRFRGGWITDERVIVFAVAHKISASQLRGAGIRPLPTEIEGVGVDVTTAPPQGLLQQPLDESLIELERVRRGAYRKPSGIGLTRVKEQMRAIIHLSPDAGYAQLSQFLKRVKETLTVGMYEFTADYIFDDLLRACAPDNCSLNLVVQRFGNNAKGSNEILIEEIVSRLTKKLGQRFAHAWAAVSEPNHIFASAYHIKVAVRDHKEIWLSSGNWKPSGQPTDDPVADHSTSSQLLRSRNREWHAIIENENLAHQFEGFLLYDLQQASGLEAPTIRIPEFLVPESFLEPMPERKPIPARYVKPLILNRELDVQPLLTPDNYVEEVQKLIDSANKRLYFQNQSLSPLEDNEDGFERLLESLKRKQADGLDVRIIFRDVSEFGGASQLRKSLERLQEFGFDMGQVRVQRGCHTKGIIVDSSMVLLGSHNWTNQGTLFNRDASLIFYDVEVAGYLEETFLFDWEYLALPKIDETRTTDIVSGQESTVAMVSIPITEFTS